MTGRKKIIRFEPPEEPVNAGNTKVTREDWLNVAMDVLVTDGVENVKVLGLSERLDVSRSSFYWYFKSRKHLLDVLLEHWDATNTRTFVEKCGLPSETITEALCYFFHCFMNGAIFNLPLDIAIREWARNSGHVRQLLDQSDTIRLTVIASMYERHGYSESEAITRARILYYMQMGYHTFEVIDSLETRLAATEGYLYAFTGKIPHQAEIDALAAYAHEHIDD